MLRRSFLNYRPLFTTTFQSYGTKVKTTKRKRFGKTVFDDTIQPVSSRACPQTKLCSREAKLREMKKKLEEKVPPPPTPKNNVVENKDALSSKIKSTSWETLGIKPQFITRIEKLGAVAPTGIQKMVIPTILKSRSLTFSSETGTGKTIAYLLPLIQRVIEKIKTENKPDLQEEVGRFAKKIKKDNLNRTNRRPRIIILVPNRELAHQVYHIIKIITSTELNTAILLGGPDRDKQSVALRKQSPDIIIGTPARILHHNSEDRLYFSKIEGLVVDEADIFVNEKQGFKDDLHKIVKNLLNKEESRKEPVQFIFVSATVSQALTSYTTQHFPLAKNIRAKYTNCPIPTVTHEFVFLKQHEKEDKLIMLIEKLKTYSGNDPVIIFCKNSKSCRAVDYHLNENGFSAVSLHSELPPLMRKEFWIKFRKGDAQILVASDIASRGIDTTKVNLVILFDFPTTGVEYLHRAGRTGRLGSSGRVISLLSKKETLFATEIQNYIKAGKSLEELSIESAIKKQDVENAKKNVVKKRVVSGKKRSPFDNPRKRREAAEEEFVDKYNRVKKFLL